MAGLDLATSRLSMCSRGIHFNLSHTREARVYARDVYTALSRSDPRSLPRRATKKYDTLRAVYTVENHHTLYIQYLIESVINYGLVTLMNHSLNFSDSYSINFCLKNLSLFHSLSINLYLLPEIIIDLSSLL